MNSDSGLPSNSGLPNEGRPAGGGAPGTSRVASAEPAVTRDAGLGDEPRPTGGGAPGTLGVESAEPAVTRAMLAVSDPVLLAFADEVGESGPVAVAGNRTRWGLGGEVDAAARIVTAPTGIVEYQPDEMTVKVRAGTSVEELHTALADAGQRTSLPERGGTVGGAFAVGENGPYVLGRGRLRTSLLQVRYVSAEGRLVTGGGPTVKNVTGFDLPRIMVGSLGTLGCLAECIIRTNPIPAVSRWMVSNDVDPFAVPDTVLRPSSVLWNGTATWVLLEGHAPAVDVEEAKLATIGSFAPADGPPILPDNRWSLTPAALRDPALLAGDGTADWVASIGVGLAWSEAPQPARPSSAGVALISERLRDNFDPDHRFNPGRVLAGGGS